MTSTVRPRRTALVLGLSCAAALSVLPVGLSHADPRPSLQEVARRVDALNAKVDVAVEDFANSRIDLAAASRRAAVALGRVRTAQSELAVLRESMSSVVAAAYRTGGTNELVSLINTANPQTFLDRAGSLDRLAATQGQQLAAAATARHRLATVQAEATREQAARAVIAAQMATQKASIERSLAQEQALLATLKAEERARLEAQRRAALVAARNQALAAAALARKAAAAEAARASRSRAQAASASAQAGPASSARATSAPSISGQSSADQSSAGQSGGSTYNGPASGRAGVAVQEAYRQLGKPYRWGASGPSEFDCSGLTSWVWAKAGVSLSHSSRAQFGEGQHVSQADIQPGDLTFYGSPIHHVGIYIGNGQMISAPHTGDVVKIQDAFRGDYVGAVRP